MALDGQIRLGGGQDRGGGAKKTGDTNSLTFPPRNTWYHTDVPPKSIWKSVKQPFTLIRQYLQVWGNNQCHPKA